MLTVVLDVTLDGRYQGGHDAGECTMRQTLDRSSNSPDGSGRGRPQAGSSASSFGAIVPSHRDGE